ncbi:uncharacterized protein LOC118193215 [Stegodyphus dumicola]|uniref:uncharacterized protein LOC118193215 n=1 Tax=Stegodyphus dumicola TaxID=202533 RepID=UPI0015B0C399|nr:uncharacterized protein LOC118193215 [Stegodyphus dumicola]
MSAIQAGDSSPQQHSEVTGSMNIPVTQSISGLTCAQVNLQRSRAATLNFIDFMIRNEIQLALLQEPYVKDGKIIGLPNCSKIFFSGSFKALIIYNGPLNPFFVARTLDAVTIRLQFINRSINITNVYFPPTADLDSNLTELCSHIIHNDHLLIAGDFNATSPLWGGNQEDHRAAKVLDFIHENRLCVLNSSDSEPTFLTVRAKGWPDITLASSPFAISITNWRVLTDISVPNCTRIDIMFAIQEYEAEFAFS